MGAIRLIQTPKNGQLIINVPDELRDEALIVEFRPVRDESAGAPHPNAGLAEASKEFFAKLNRVKVNFNEEDYNVYEQ